MTIVHLIDDCSPGGVVRFLDRLTEAPQLGTQKVTRVRRGAWSAPRVEADIIVSHLVMSWRNLPQLMALRAKHPSTPIIHVEHSYSEGFARLHVRNRYRFAAMLRVAYALFDRVVAVSKAQADWLLQEDLIAEEVLRIISPTVSLERFLAIPSQSGPLRRIGAIGRLDAQKGFDILIDAFRGSALAGMELTIFGDGPDRMALEAAAAGDNRISFYGFADPVEAMTMCDVMAMPSRFEPYGLVALEARAAGRMILTSGVDGLADQAEFGAVTVGEDVHAWRNALRSLNNNVERVGDEVVRRKARYNEFHCLTKWQELLSEFNGSQANLVAVAA